MKLLPLVLLSIIATLLLVSCGAPSESVDTTQDSVQEQPVKEPVEESNNKEITPRNLQTADDTWNAINVTLNQLD